MLHWNQVCIPSHFWDNGPQTGVTSLTLQGRVTREKTIWFAIWNILLLSCWNRTSIFNHFQDRHHRRSVPSSIRRVCSVRYPSPMITIYCCCNRFIDLHPSPFSDVICPTPALSTTISVTWYTSLNDFLLQNFVFPCRMTIKSQLQWFYAIQKSSVNF